MLLLSCDGAMGLNGATAYGCGQPSMGLCQAGPALSWEGASAPALQLLPQGGDSLLLGPHHRHGTDLQPLGRSPQRQALQDREPQGCGLGGGQLLDQLLQRQAMDGLSDGPLGFWSGQLIEQAGLAINAGIEAEVPQRALTLLMQPPRHAHQPHPIAQVVLQGPSDAATQIRSWRLTGSAAGSGADQGLASHLDQILPLHQREQAPGHGGGDGIGKGQVLQHQGIAGKQGRAAEGGSGGSHRQDGGEPHPQRPAEAPRQGRPTTESAWPDP